MLFVSPCIELILALSLVGLNSTKVAAGNLARFQLIFKLTSDVNPNYLHIHTLKGIAVASRVCATVLTLLHKYQLLDTMPLQKKTVSSSLGMRTRALLLVVCATLQSVLVPNTPCNRNLANNRPKQGRMWLCIINR